MNYAFENGLAAIRDEVQLLLGQAGGDGVAADCPTLFVLKDDHFQRMAQRDFVLGQRLRHLDRAHRADVAVIIAAFGHGIDMRTDDQGLQARVIAGASPDDVARRVNADVQLRLAHQLHRILAALQIGLAVGDAADAALRVFTELRQLAQMVIDLAAR